MNVKNRQQLLTIVAIGCIALWLGNKLIFVPLTGTLMSVASRMV